MDEKVYERVTEFFEKENRRIGSRISWVFATQTLIFAGFEYVNKYEIEFRIQFLSAIGKIGFWTSVCFTLSILAAAINYMCIYYPLARKGVDEFPNLRGGKIQSWLCIPLGFVGAVGLPVILAVAWFYIPGPTPN